MHFLGRADLLDERGGTDIVQVAPASVTFDRGTSRIAGVRLSPKGLFRWHCDACKTPLGNHAAVAIPLVGLSMALFREGRDAARRDSTFGPPRGRVFGKFAVGEPPAGSMRLDPRMVLHVAGRLAAWKLRGAGFPHPFVDDVTRAPMFPVKVLSKAERDALRPLCGPRPR